MLNRAINGTGFMNAWIDSLILIGFAVLLFYYCQWNIKRKWILKKNIGTPDCKIGGLC
jgi:hypothetical protein